MESYSYLNQNNIYLNAYDLTSLTSHSLSQLKNILESCRHTKYIFITTVIKHSKLFFLWHSNIHTAALAFTLQQTLFKNLKLTYISNSLLQICLSTSNEVAYLAMCSWKTLAISPRGGGACRHAAVLHSVYPLSNLLCRLAIL